MTANETSSKRIARNTLFLYIRMAFILIVSLYTSRVVLNTLGIVDYGVYNVVAGFVSMFTFLNSSLSSGIQRYYNFYLGKNGETGVQQVYITSLIIQVLLSVIILILLESFGIWYLNNVLVIPGDRMVTVHVLFQVSVISLILVILEIPYSGIIMAYERMDYYAIVGIADVLLKLIIVIALPYLPYNKLIVYSCLSLSITIVNFLLYFIYAKYRFHALKIRKWFSAALFKSMLSFSGWNIAGTFAFMLKSQGLNMLLNYFFGPVVNAARGIASQVQAAMQGFSSNIAIAFRPQLVTSYAAEEFERTRRMMFSEAKICYILLCTLVVPAVIEIGYILHIWLGNMVPAYTVPFTVLVLADMLLGTLNTPFTQVAHATGKLKVYQTVTSAINCLIIPVSWIFLRHGFSPVSVFVVSLLMTVVNQIGCMVVVRKLFPYGLINFSLKVILPCMVFTISLLVIPLVIRYLMPESFLRLIMICITALITAVIMAYWIMLNNEEKKLALTFIRRKYPNV